MVAQESMLLQAELANCHRCVSWFEGNHAVDEGKRVVRDHRRHSRSSGSGSGVREWSLHDVAVNLEEMLHRFEVFLHRAGPRIAQINPRGSAALKYRNGHRGRDMRGREVQAR